MPCCVSRAPQAAGKPLLRGSFTRGAADGSPLFNPLDLRFKNVANTGVLHWGGKLYALWEVRGAWGLWKQGGGCQGHKDCVVKCQNHGQAQKCKRDRVALLRTCSHEQHVPPVGGRSQLSSSAVHGRTGPAGGPAARARPRHAGHARRVAPRRCAEQRHAGGPLPHPAWRGRQPHMGGVLHAGAPDGSDDGACAVTCVWSAYVCLP